MAMAQLVKAKKAENTSVLSGRLVYSRSQVTVSYIQITQPVIKDLVPSTQKHQVYTFINLF